MTLLEDCDIAGPHMHIMSPEDGDTVHRWDPTVRDEVDAARAVFDELVTRRRFLAYRMEDSGKGALLRSFDPAAGEMVLSPQHQGG